MTDSSDWEFPEEVRPRAEGVAYDLDAALSSVLELRAEIPSDAFTAPILGTERAGNAVAIDDNGLVLTIGYLILEAENPGMDMGKAVAEAKKRAQDWFNAFFFGKSSV